MDTPLILLTFAGLTVTVSIVVATLAISLVHSYASAPVHKKSASILFVLGSGGHTTELLSIASDLDFSLYKSRTYLAFSGDSLSLVRALKQDQAQPSLPSTSPSPTTLTIPRARSVGQPYWSSLFTSALCGVSALFVLLKQRPDVILCNGPGSSVLVCIASLVLRATRIKVSRIVYVESLARVNSLSLTGRLMLLIADRFIVQWPELQEKYKSTEYFGILA
ncbi:oligosaccharide biosynthesis protein Alg14 like-domain-containing protein [Lipomyces arxii]|uniref:oligosaccharide biosynthesis protein Alg14 like-domain-containing protein n=1 Tax=Lipomyces arxii TaxID=56418 RepID=UPI0034CD7F8A